MPVPIERTPPGCSGSYTWELRVAQVCGMLQASAGVINCANMWWCLCMLSGFTAQLIRWRNIFTRFQKGLEKQLGLTELLLPTGGCARQENSDVLWGVPWRGMRAFRKVVKAEWWRKAGRGETASMPQAHSQSHELLGRRNFKEKRHRADP